MSGGAQHGRSWKGLTTPVLLLGSISLAYAAVFIAVRGWSAPLPTLVFRNSAALLLAVALVWPLLSRALSLGGWRAAISHALLAAAFSLLWAWILTVSAAIINAGSGISFSVAPLLLGAAAEWQLLQGLFAYAALAFWRAAALARRDLAAAQAVAGAPDAVAKPPRPLLVRSGDEVISLDPDEIVMIVGADDYSEVRTGRANCLVRTTLTEFEDLLDDRRFLRVHRSIIVNTARIDRAEPAGNGRTLLHLRGGETVQTSRNGARLLRERLL